MNVNQLKNKLRKIKNYVWYKNILDKSLLTDLKEKSPLYVDGEGLTNNQKNKKEDISMNYFPKIEYWRTLVPNYDSVGETTNPPFKNTRASSVAENQYASAYLCSQQLTKI